MVSIVVSGDLVRDIHIKRHFDSRGPNGRFNNVVHSDEPGGAWFLKKLVKSALSDLESQLDLRCTNEIPHCEGLPIGKTFSTWEQKKSNPGDKEKIWRVTQFLGCEIPEISSGGDSIGMVDLDGQEINDDLMEPDVLVIDDLSHSFRYDDHLWPISLREGSPKRIILKMNAAPEKCLLLDHLFGKFSDVLTVVISADTLRERGASLSKGVSWDRSIEEIAKEFEKGQSAYDLAQCRRVIVHFGGIGVASFTRCPLKIGPPQVKDLSEKVIFERFVYHPEALEGQQFDGNNVVGFGSILTASVTRFETDPDSFPLFISLSRGLVAIQAYYNAGGNYNFRIETELHPPSEEENSKALQFFSAFPHRVLNDPKMKKQLATQSNLLQDETGPSLSSVLMKGIELVQYGASKALKKVPKAKYGNFFTVDRDEIERFNMIANLISTYQNDPKDTKPLSIAVFGPPGSGKSFAIKQIAKQLLPGATPLEFNLSEFSPNDMPQLYQAFHQVRDNSIKGTIPLVFWDEFDTGKLQWLKYFLAPMQDAEFREDNLLHPFGKAVFVFAGGTRETFEKFNQPDDDFKDQKGPDFVSRLRGFVNIKGPNPQGDPTEDSSFYIRRALMLRSLIERNYKHLIDDSSGAASISVGIIHGLLNVKKYCHGARSLESMLTTCDLQNFDQFVPAQLVSTELLEFHVSEDFMDEVDRGEMEMSVSELVASKIHSGWKNKRIEEGWKFGETFDNKQKTDPRLVPFEELSLADKENNRMPVQAAHSHFEEMGYRIQKCLSKSPKKQKKLSTKELNQYARLEHDRWVRARMLRGYEWCEPEKRNDKLRLHHDICPTEQLSEGEDQYDKDIAKSIIHALWEEGYELVNSLDS